MSPLQQALRDFRTLRVPINPPATTEELAQLEMLIGQRLPADLLALYQDHNGHELTFDPEIDDDTDVVGLLFRLLSISELSAVWGEEMRQGWLADYPDVLNQFLPCWFDDNANYTVLYIAGPLAGRLAYLNHEFGFNLRPQFKGLPSYYASLIQAARENSYEYTTDYPTVQLYPVDDLDDLAAFEYCIDQYRHAQDPGRRMFYSYNALYVCPFAHTSALYELLADANDHLQGEVCSILATRNWTDAIGQLGRVVLARQSLSFVPAIDALGKLRDPAAAEELIRLASQLHPYDLCFVVDALKQHEYTAREIPRSNGKYTTYQVCQGTNQEWINLCGYEVQP
jgi:hypothetical protein